MSFSNATLKIVVQAHILETDISEPLVGGGSSCPPAHAQSQGTAVQATAAALSALFMLPKLDVYS